MLVQRKHRTRWAIIVFFSLLYVYRKHMSAGIALVLEPFIFSFGNNSFLLSHERDDFDVTFEKYPSAPEISPADDISYPVPPIVHTIFLGPKRARPEWDQAT